FSQITIEDPYSRTWNVALTGLYGRELLLRPRFSQITIEDPYSRTWNVALLGLNGRSLLFSQ
ncbi:MAG: hypothetical protein ABF908_06270, partial [Lentilactobacillus diolivorans]